MPDGNSGHSGKGRDASARSILGANHPRSVTGDHRSSLSARTNTRKAGSPKALADTRRSRRGTRGLHLPAGGGGAGDLVAGVFRRGNRGLHLPAGGGGAGDLVAGVFRRGNRGFHLPSGGFAGRDTQTSDLSSGASSDRSWDWQASHNRLPARVGQIRALYEWRVDPPGTLAPGVGFPPRVPRAGPPSKNEVSLPEALRSLSPGLPCHGTGTRYRLRCTLSRLKAYISAVGPGATSLAGIMRTPGSFKISCSDLGQWRILSGTGWPGDNGKT